MLWRTLPLGAVFCLSLLPVVFQPAMSRAEDDEEGEEQKPRKTGAGPSEREQKVLSLFSATSKRFEDGRIILVYDFLRQEDALAADWAPAVDRTWKSRIHWTSQGEADQLQEGSSSGLYSSRRKITPEGIVLADYGQWVHKAAFLPDVEVEVDVLNLAPPRAGTILGPILHDEKKKLSIGVNAGYQAMCLNGLKPKKQPYPKSDKVLPRKVRETIGLKYNGKAIECYLNDKKTADTSQVPAFTEGFDTGHVGLAWSGSVKAYLYSVTIRGRLDPDWAAQSIGEKGGKPEKEGRAGSGQAGGSKGKAPAGEKGA